jgi:hypothetical protein
MKKGSVNRQVIGIDQGDRFSHLWVLDARGEAMPLRRTKRSDGQKRPRWKDGSHDPVESTRANESRSKTVAIEPSPETEQRVGVAQLLQLTPSTRDRRASTGADARIEESEATGDLRLAILPYGKANKRGFLRPRI